MLNIEKYKNEIAECKKRCELGNLVCKLSEESFCKTFNPECGKCKELIIKWLFSEYKEQILDDAERKYLADVIRPFRKEVATISKFNAFDGSQYIYIEMKDRRGSNLPTFPKGTMYKGMIEGMHYSLEELGL